MSYRLLLLGVLLLTPRDAQAYLDPGSGSLIFQAIAALLAGVLVAVRIYWTRIKGFVGKSATDSSKGNASEDRSVDDARDE